MKKLVLLNAYEQEEKSKNQQFPQRGQSLYEVAIDLYAPPLWWYGLSSFQEKDTKFDSKIK